MSGLPPDWLVPGWPVPARVRAACTVRTGGVSVGPFASLNLGDHVGDDPASVARNRAIHAGAIGSRPVYLKQVHGTDVIELGAQTADGAQADACWTTAPGIACTIMVADCLPVLMADCAGRCVAAAHVGWRGLAGGVLESLWAAFWPQVASDARSAARETFAWLGPCIGPAAFEVGDDVRGAFLALDGAGKRHFRPHAPGKWLADLPGLARDRLQALAIDQVHGNDGSSGWCTVSDASRFFSYRRDRVSGRLAASIWLT